MNTVPKHTTNCLHVRRLEGNVVHPHLREPLHKDEIPLRAASLLCNSLHPVTNQDLILYSNSLAFAGVRVANLCTPSDWRARNTLHKVGPLLDTILRNTRRCISPDMKAAIDDMPHFPW